MRTRLIICSSLALLCLYTVCAAASEQSQDEAIGIVLDILKSGDKDMRAVAIVMVKDMPGVEVTQALVKELPNLSATSQVQLLSALGERGDTIALPAVINTVKAKDESVRIAALKALGQLGDETSVNLLAKVAGETKGQEQKAARQSLYSLRGGKIDDVILENIPKEQSKTKVELIKSLSERNISRGVSVLLKTANDSSRKARTESFKVLKVIAGPENLPALIELLLNVRSSSDTAEAQKTIAAVAHKIEDKNKQAEMVLKILPSVREVKKQCSLLGVLGKIGDSSALPRLREALNSDSDEIRAVVIRALAEWPDSEPASDLLRTAQNTDNKLHKILALRGSVRLLGLDNGREAEETIEMYKKAMSLAPDAGEKKRVLSGLAKTKSLEALQMATGYLEDATLSNEAEYAAVKISENIYESFPKETKDVLEKIVRNSKNDLLRQQAQEVINKIKQ